jgi:hypothetical protein
MSEAQRNRAWRAYADARRRISRAGSDSGATLAHGGTSRADQVEWIRQTAARHDRYRSAIAPAHGSVAVLCVSMRPHMVRSVADNVRRQAIDALDLVFVVNLDDDELVDLAPIEGLADRIRVVVLRRPADVSLGACLNDAMGATDARFVAKFDDDDRYGPHFLVDALRAHRYAGAGVVGKHTYYAHLATTDETVLRFPTNEFRDTSTLAGGTLVIDRERTGEVRFADRSLGEDGAFIAACHRRGVSTFAADRFNYVQTRATDNTWATTRTAFLEQTIAVGSGLPLDSIEI